MVIRSATHADLPAIMDIFNHEILNAAGIYVYDPVTLENRAEWLEGRARQGYPVLVASEGDTVMGYSSFGDFRAFPGFLHTVEHSVYVHKDHRGKGLGLDLITSLFAPAFQLGKHVMVGAIDSGNHGSIRLHEKLGFMHVGTFPEVGRKFGRWLDMVCMQRFIDGQDAA